MIHALCKCMLVGEIILAAVNSLPTGTVHTWAIAGIGFAAAAVYLTQPEQEVPNGRNQP